MTLRIANVYYKLMKEKHHHVHLLDLVGKNVWERGDEMKQIENDLLIPAQKIVLIMPEYNGSFPGILKLMMDNSDVRKAWWHKKIMMVGVADGRAGNLRGLDHMTNILHYLKAHVFFNKLPISRINEEINEAGEVLKPVTERVIQQQVDEFLNF